MGQTAKKPLHDTWLLGTLSRRQIVLTHLQGLIPRLKFVL